MRLADLPLFASLRQKAEAPMPAWIKPALEPGRTAWLCLAPGRCEACGQENGLAFIAVQDELGPVVALATTTEDGAFDEPIAERLETWQGEAPWLPIGPIRSVYGWGIQLCRGCGQELPDFDAQAARRAYPEVPPEHRRELDAGDITLYYLDLRDDLSRDVE